MRRTLSLVIILSLAPVACASAARAQGRERGALRVHGEVLSVTVGEHGKSSVSVDVKIRLRFINASPRPLILLDREPWRNMGGLAFSAEDAAAGRFVFTRMHLPSVYRAPGTEWGRVLRGLDSKTPPAGLTRTLAPGGHWAWETDYGWVISKRGESAGGTLMGRDEKSWDELRQASELWLTLSFQMWPNHVEMRRTGRSDDVTKLGDRLRRRWQAFGDLWLDDVNTEPMRVEVKDVPVKVVARAGNSIHERTENHDRENF